MIINDKETYNKKFSSETSDTDSTNSPVPKIETHTTMLRQQTSVIVAVEEETTDEETVSTPISPSPPSKTKVMAADLTSPLSVQQAVKAAYAIMDGVSVSEVDLRKDAQIFEVDLNDETSAGGDVKVPKNFPGSVYSRDMGSAVSALSDVACDRMSMSSAGSATRGSHASNVRILRTPDGRRKKRSEAAVLLATEKSFPSLELTQEAEAPPSIRPARQSWASDELGVSISSAPEQERAESADNASYRSTGSTGSERSYPSTVRILRTSNGRRRTRRPSVTSRQTFACMVKTVSDSDLSPPPRPSAITADSRRVQSDKVVPPPLLVDNDDLDKSVGFGSIKIRYYDRVIDVNPACSSGVAIGLGWKYNKSRGLTVDEYELQKGGVRYHARQLLLPRNVREDIAREFGFTQRDIAKGTRANLKIRNERKQTIDNLSMMTVEEKLEGAKRKMKKVLSFRRKRAD